VPNKSHYVAVVGAGPAGIFAARELARAGARVVVFNRDIKPGGLAEYGIHPDKQSMKQALRTQFQQALDTPGITYYGNIRIGQEADLTLEDLRACGFQAILVTAGAQGTKWLGIPGEELTGVYHAKDLVYHYNQLPPFSQREFRFGKRAAIVGAGNVMLDIARFLMQKGKVEEVVAVVRRGPAEVKFDKKEMEFVIGNLDLRALDEEICRVSPIMEEIGQSPEQAKSIILEALPKAQPAMPRTRFRFHFLASPDSIIGDGNNHVSGLELTENTLIVQNGDVKARHTGRKTLLPVETIIFAIGDKVDENFGLPTHGSEFAKNPHPRFPVEEHSYEAYDPNREQVIPDVFVAGWSRQASSGLVGYARKDGTNGSKAVLQYLQTLAPVMVDPDRLSTKLKGIGKPVVLLSDVRNLLEIEGEEAQKRGLAWFKFNTNEEMLEKIMSVG
jgi:ferredoxin--NADP+ reductase